MTSKWHPHGKWVRVYSTDEIVELFMSLLQRMENDRNAARRDSRSEDTAFYSYLIAKAREPGKSDKDGPRDSSDEEVVAVVQKLMRENTETLEQGQGQGEERLRRQNKFLQTYLPTQLSEEKLTDLIGEMLTQETQDGSARSKRMLGPIMKALKENYGGQYAPALASQIATRLIES